MTTPLLRATGICFAYDGVDVLHGVDARLHAGTTTAIVGPNGAGKSTLIEIMAGTLRPRRGSIDRRGEVAFVVQRVQVPPTLPLSIREVVEMGTWGSRGAASVRRSRIGDALERVGLTALERRSIHAVSGGQRPRALIAQGLARLTGVGGILLLDEPGAGLDVASRSAIRRILSAEAARGHAIGWVTHDDEDVAHAEEVIELGQPAAG
ncbi:MAG: metal ABC transporter ATP-binding protein [Microbacterium sp.]